MTNSPLNVAESLAPMPDREDVPTVDWLRHYAATALAAYAHFHAELGDPPYRTDRPRPELGYLAALGNAALAAAVALTHTEDYAPQAIWQLTPEQGALNGEWEDWLVKTLDGLGVNPADIDSRYTAGDFRSPSRAVTA